MSQGAILPVSAAHDSFFEPYQVYRGIGNDTDRELDFGADSNLPLRDLGTPPDTQTGVSSKDAASFVQLLEPKDYSKARPNRKRNYLTPALSRIETSKRSLGHRLPWRWEILSWLMSLLAFLAIVIILAIHDGQPIPQWRFGITLNAMISILSTLGTITLISPLTAGLGQLKWTWFRRHRPLTDFELIDQASRGIWGSLILLRKGRGGLLAVIGAILMILTIAVHPFIQQIISYTAKETHDGFAQLPTAITLNSTDLDFQAYSEFGAPQYYTDVTLTGAIYNGLFSLPATAFNVTASCSSPKCMWPSYRTLAVCSSCQDISDSLVVTNAHVNLTGFSEVLLPTFRLPNNLSLEEYPGNPPFVDNYIQTVMQFTNRGGNADSSTGFISGQQDSVFSSVAYKDRGSAIGGLFSISNDSRAIECLFQYCVKQHTAVYLNGTLYETITSTWTNNSVPARSWEVVEDVGEPQFTLKPPDQGDIFLVDHVAHIALMNTFASLSNGNVTLDFVGLISLEPIITYTSDVTKQLYNTMNNASMEAMEELMGRVADSLTLAFRSRPGFVNIAGTAVSDITVVQIEWFWMIMPLTLLLLALVFLIIVIINTRRTSVEVWKSNTLATLYHGLDESAIAGLGLLSRIDHMEDASEGLLVRLHVGEKGWRLAADQSMGRDGRFGSVGDESSSF